MEEINPRQWYNKVIVSDTSSPRLLNRNGKPLMNMEDILDGKLMGDLLEKLKAVFIHVSIVDFALSRGYQVDEHMGGHIYSKEGVRFSPPCLEMSEETSKFLDERNLRHSKGVDYVLRDGLYVKDREMIGDFWLKSKPTLSELAEISSIHFVDEVNMFVHYNTFPSGVQYISSE